jgi:hypothetical protein
MVNFLTFCEAILQKPIATLYFMKNVRYFPYKTGHKQRKSSLVSPLFHTALESLANTARKGKKT